MTRLSRIYREDSSDQHTAVGEPPVAIFLEPDAAVAGDCQESLGGRAVGPEFDID